MHQQVLGVFVGTRTFITEFVWILVRWLMEGLTWTPMRTRPQLSHGGRLNAAGDSRLDL